MEKKEDKVEKEKDEEGKMIESSDYSHTRKLKKINWRTFTLRY